MVALVAGRLLLTLPSAAPGLARAGQLLCLQSHGAKAMPSHRWPQLACASCTCGGRSGEEHISLSMPPSQLQPVLCCSREARQLCCAHCWTALSVLCCATGAILLSAVVRCHQKPEAGQKSCAEPQGLPKPLCLQPQRHHSALVAPSEALCFCLALQLGHRDSAGRQRAQMLASIWPAPKLVCMSCLGCFAGFAAALWHWCLLLTGSDLLKGLYQACSVGCHSLPVYSGLLVPCCHSLYCRSGLSAYLSWMTGCHAMQA